MDFGLIKRAGLTQAEFGHLCGVSRVTVNMWVKRKMNPHRLLQQHVANVFEGVAGALEAKDLPPPRSVTPGERQKYIQRVVTDSWNRADPEMNADTP